MLYIVGLGASDITQLPLGVRDILKKGYPIFLRTDQHPMIHFFEDENIPFTSFDSIYEKCDTFESVYEEIIHQVKNAAKNQDIIYAVPGHPMVAEYTVKRLMSECKAKIVGGQSFLDAMFATLKIDPIDGLMIIDALDFHIERVHTSINLMIPQVFDQMTASNLKLDLMDKYPDEYQVCIVCGAGSMDEKCIWLPLYQLDHDFELNNLTTVFVPAMNIDEVD